MVVIGGGDTGSDCIGTSIRQGALSVTNFEIMPQPPERENKPMTWPDWPLKLRTSSSHEEGAKRHFAVMTQKFSGADGQVKKLHCVHVDERMKPVAGTEFDLPADLVLLAMGFVHPVHEGLIAELGLALDPRGNVKADTVSYQSSNPKVFSAGDMRRGQSLVVWAIREGRQTAHAVDKYLMGVDDVAAVKGCCPGLEPGPFQTSAFATIPALRCTTRKSCVLHRVREKDQAEFQNSAPNGPSGSASADSRSAAVRANASSMALRVAACSRCSGASQVTAAPNASATIRPVSAGKISHGTASVVAKNSRSQCSR